MKITIEFENVTELLQWTTNFEPFYFATDYELQDIKILNLQNIQSFLYDSKDIQITYKKDTDLWDFVLKLGNEYFDLYQLTSFITETLITE